MNYVYRGQHIIRPGLGEQGQALLPTQDVAQSYHERICFCLTHFLGI